MTLTSSERGTIGVTESPVVPVPSGPASYLFNVQDVVLEWTTVSRNLALTTALQRTGQLPEGTYEACARVLVGTGQTQVAEHCASFTILQPDPPQLLAPQDGESVVSTQPFLQWTPVLAPPAMSVFYEVQVAEVLGTQQPRVALDANIPVLREVTSSSFLLYPIDALPLERARRYAWRVRAVDADGRQLFRDGVQSEIRTFDMADELLQPVPRAGSLPDTLVLQPGVAYLVGVRRAEVTRATTDVVVDGTLALEFVGAGRVTPGGFVSVAGLRAVLRDGALIASNGRVEVPVPTELIPASLREFVAFAPMVFTPATGFRASATLKVPGQPGFPLTGAVQLTPGGLFGRLEGAGAGGATILRIGRAPVQYAAQSARITLPDGRLELGGEVRLFEQSVGCPASGVLVDGVVQVPVFCDPMRGFRPDASSERALLTFGTLSGSLAADFLTDTLGTDLQSAVTFRVLGEGSDVCTLRYTMTFARTEIRRSNEQPSCSAGESVADLGWVRLSFSNLRMDRLEYEPGRTLAWRALVDITPSVVGVDQLQLPTMRDVRLDADGVFLAPVNSAAPGSQNFSLFTIGDVDIVPRTMGFRGGLIPYARWLSGGDPGLEWGTGDAWVRLAHIDPTISGCVDEMPIEADTLVIRGGTIDAPFAEHRWTNGCVVLPASTLKVRLMRAEGRFRFALGAPSRVTELPVVQGMIENWKPGCARWPLGCEPLFDSYGYAGEVRLTPQGRLRGAMVGLEPPFAAFSFRFAKFEIKGGRLDLGVDSTGAQTAIYDGPAKVSFEKLAESKPAEPKEEPKEGEAKKEAPSKSLAEQAAGFALGIIEGIAADTVRTPVRIDWVKERLLAGRAVLKGPFEMKLGFIPFLIGEATLDTAGLHVDGRQRMVLERTKAEAKTGTGAKATDSTYTTEKDTTGVTFAGVRIDPGTGDLTAGTIAFDASVALSADPMSTAISLAAAPIGGAISGGEAGADSAFRAQTQSTEMYGFKLIARGGSFDPTASVFQLGRIKLDLANSPTITSAGLRINGTAPAHVAFLGSRYDSASVSFENGFAILPAQGRVASGRALVKVRQYPIAYLDQSGWHIALSELVRTVIPDTLFLFDDQTAFVVLKDANKRLLVDVTETNEGPRIQTKAGEPVRLVFPAFKGSRTTTPSAEVVLDLTLERGSYRPLAGEAIVRAAADTPDLFGPELPFTMDSVVMRVRREELPGFHAHGRLRLLPGEEQRPMRVAIGIGSGGELSAEFEQPFTQALSLVEGSPLFRFQIDTLRFTAQGKLGRGFTWRLETPGRVNYFDAARQREMVLAQATFRLSPTEAALVDFHGLDSVLTVPLPGVDLRLGRLRAPTFRWDLATRRFDFELLFDVGLSVPALDSLRLPEIRDIRVTPFGIVVPAVEVGSTAVAATTPAEPPGPGGFTTTGSTAPTGPPVVEVRVGGFRVSALAYRVSEFRWNWFAGAPPPQFDFGVDLEFAIDDLPARSDGQTARIALRALNVGVTNGEFTGSFEPIDIPVPIRTPVADIRGAFGSFRLPATGAPDIRIGLHADLRLPDVLACPDAAARRVNLSNANDTLFLASNGTFYGSIRNVLPQCPAAIGPFELQFGQSTVRFGYDAERQRVDADLDASVTLRVPSATPGQTVSVTGRIVVDIDENRIEDASVVLDRPFFWAPDPANPFLRLIVSQASLTRDELRFGATGQLRTSEGAGVDVTFADIVFDLNTLELKEGMIRLTADAAIGFEIPEEGGLLFGVYPVSTPRGGTASARLVLPSGAVIDTGGLHIGGTASASLAFGGNEYLAINGEFADGFTIGTAGTVAIRRGRLNLRDSTGTLIAYADSLGFWPGNVFAVLPIPARLGIPSEDVAWIQLRNPADTAQLLIETEFTSETVRLRTRPGQRVEVGLPALANGGPVPRVQAEFDLLMNLRNMRPISGGLALVAPPGQALVELAGMPIEITELGFGADTGGFRLRAGARAELPGPLAGVPLEFRGIEITSAGLTGEIELGEFSELYDPMATPIAEVELLGDTLTLAFTGAQLTLRPANNVLRISGGVRSTLLKGYGGAPRGINLAATIDRDGFRAVADVADPELPFDIGVASFTLEGDAGEPPLVIEANAQAFEVVLSGSIRLPGIAPGFALGVDGFTVGSAGVRIPSVSVTMPSSTKEFDLFGAKFALRDSVVGSQQVAPAIDIQVDRGTVRFTLSGYVTLMANTTRFIGLRFGTDGTFSLQGASFISRPIDIIPNVARLVSARITQGNLEFVGDFKLPAPFTQQAPQQLLLRIAPNGAISGGGRVVIISEAEGLATAQTKLSLGVAAFHLRHLDVAFDFADLEATSASVVADIYIQEKQANLLRFGRVNGGTVTPGLRIALNGDVTFGGLQMPNPIEIDLDPVKLKFTRITSTSTPTGFAVDISGELGLTLDAVSGHLSYSNLRFTSEGEVQLGTVRLDGGALTIQETVKITVSRLAFSDQDTSIYVPAKARPGPGGVLRPDSTLVPVQGFLDFGASISISTVFHGSVHRLLFYVRSDDETTHFLIQGLRVQISEVLEFEGSFSYDELPNGFDMSLSARGLILQAYDVGIVGVLSRNGDLFRAGLFVRASVTIPLGPVVTLTEVGGGFFINPLAEDLEMVRLNARFTGPSASRMGMPTDARFAILLYAGFAVAGANGASAAKGRTLVTITDAMFQLNAEATFLEMDNELKGELVLQVGWKPETYVRGDVTVSITIEGAVSGTAGIQFFAGGNQFAVVGTVNLLIVEVIRATAEVIVVPSGFTAQLGFNISAEAGPVRLGVTSTMRIWFRPSTNDLGAYIRIAGNVSVFGIGGRLELIGALVVLPEFAVYAQGSAAIDGIEQARVDVWVQYTSAGFAAGVGKNEELAAVLARAEQIAADLEAEANRILAGISGAALERARTPQAVSDASLAAAYANFQRWDPIQMVFLWTGFRMEEGRLYGGLLPQSASDPYVTFYEGTLRATDAASDTARIRQLREVAQQKLAVINDRRAAVEERIRALRLELEAAETAAQFIPPPDPVRAWSTGAPRFVAGATDPSGRRIMELVDAPQFDLDDQASAAAKATMTTARAATRVAPERLRAQLETVEAGLATVVAATRATDPASFASYARVHSELVDAIEEQHAANVAFRMRRRGWAQAKLDTLAQQRTALETRLQQRLTTITQFQLGMRKSEPATRFGTLVQLDSLALSRARFLSAWSGDATILQTYTTDRTAEYQAAASATQSLLNDPENRAASGTLDVALQWFQTRAVGFGVNAWWGVANAGLAQARDGAQALVDSAAAQAAPVIRAMRDMHARFTTSLAELNARQAELHGVLFDLYDGYLRYYPGDSNATPYTARKAALGELLRAPTVSSPQVTVTDFGYLASIRTTWSGAHPRGVYEYLQQEGPDSLLTVGGTGEARRWQYTVDPNGGSRPQVQRVYVRGGAGLTAQQLVPYTVTFARGSTSSPVTQVAVPPADLTAPSAPVVSFPGLFSVPDEYGSATYWTGDSTRLALSFSASDNESGVGEYEYRIYLAPTAPARLLGGNVYRPMSLNAVPTTEELVPWTSAGGRTSITIPTLNLPSGRQIGVMVRAKNGAGITGPEGYAPWLRYDGTRPVFATGAALQPALAATSLGTTFPRLGGAFVVEPVYPACAATLSRVRGAGLVKPWDGKLVTVTANNTIVGGGLPVRMSFTMPAATDPETGIGAYNYRVDSVAPSAELPTDGWYDIPVAGPSFLATGPTFVHGRPRWITYVARNQAGRASQPLVYGPITVADPSVPTTPVFCGDYASGGFIAFMTTPATDDETGIRGYQLRIRGPNGTVVRDWPSAGAVDWPAAQAGADQGIRIAIAPAVGGPHRVELRAVSGLGVAGGAASSGDILVDLTAPPAAALAGTVSGGNAVLNLSLSNDPESGIAGVDVAFANGPDDPTFAGGRTRTVLLMPYGSYPASAGNGRLTIPLAAGAATASPLYALVRARNGVGLVSTVVAVRIR